MRGKQRERQRFVVRWGSRRVGWKSPSGFPAKWCWPAISLALGCQGRQDVRKIRCNNDKRSVLSLGVEIFDCINRAGRSILPPSCHDFTLQLPCVIQYGTGTVPGLQRGTFLFVSLLCFSLLCRNASPNILLRWGCKITIISGCGYSFRCGTSTSVCSVLPQHAHLSWRRGGGGQGVGVEGGGLPVRTADKPNRLKVFWHGPVLG